MVGLLVENAQTIRSLGVSNRLISCFCDHIHRESFLFARLVHFEQAEQVQFESNDFERRAEHFDRHFDVHTHAVGRSEQHKLNREQLELERMAICSNQFGSWLFIGWLFARIVHVHANLLGEGRETTRFALFAHTCQAHSHLFTICHAFISVHICLFQTD